MIQQHVLDNGTRVLAQSGMLKAIGITSGGSGSRGGDRLAKFVGGNRLKAFITNELEARTENPIKFKGYELDADYYRDSTARLEAFRAQPKLFTGNEIFRATQGEQGALFEL